jgi:hypothetical protein
MRFSPMTASMVPSRAFSKMPHQLVVQPQELLGGELIGGAVEALGERGGAIGERSGARHVRGDARAQPRVAADGGRAAEPLLDLLELRRGPIQLRQPHRRIGSGSFQQGAPLALHLEGEAPDALPQHRLLRRDLRHLGAGQVLLQLAPGGGDAGGQGRLVAQPGQGLVETEQLRVEAQHGDHSIVGARAEGRQRRRRRSAPLRPRQRPAEQGPAGLRVARAFSMAATSGRRSCPARRTSGAPL